MFASFVKHTTANTAIIIAKKMPAEKTTIYIPLPVSVITALKEVNQNYYTTQKQNKHTSHKSKTMPTFSFLFVIHTIAQNAIIKASIVPKSTTDILNTPLSLVAVLTAH